MYRTTAAGHKFGICKSRDGRVGKRITPWPAEYIYIYICICIYTYIHNNITHNDHSNTNKHINVYTHICIYVYAYISAHKLPPRWAGLAQHT